MTPYLQLLLNRKRNDPSTYGNWNERLPDGSPSLDISERGGTSTGPTIPLKTVPRVPAQDETPQQPTVPIVAPASTIPLGPRPTMDRGYQPFQNTAQPVNVDPWTTRIETDRQRVIDAQNKPHSKWKDVGEGLADWAAGGLGIPLRRIMHPRGSETEQAQRQLGTDLALQKQGLETQDQQSTIQLRNRQIAKIDNELNNPDTSDEDKADLRAIEEGLKLFEGQASTPENDAAYAQLKARAAKKGIILPNTYGPQARVKAEKEPIFKVVDKADGSKVTKRSDDNGKTWIEVPDLASEAPSKPEPESPPDTTANWATLEAGFRKNAANALTAAQKAEQDAKNYIASQTTAKGASFDPTKDANVAALTAESRRQRAFAEEQTKKADDAAFKKTEAAASDAKAGAKSSAKSRKVSRGTSAPATHDFSIRAYIQRNKGATEADARAFAKSNYPNYSVVP